MKHTQTWCSPCILRCCSLLCMPSAVPPGTPRAAPDRPTTHCIDTLHGHTLGMAALLVAAARTPLGVPSRLPFSAYWIAKRLILQPYCRWVGCSVGGCLAALVLPPPPLGPPPRESAWQPWFACTHYCNQ
jgi:hypothetical protein